MITIRAFKTEQNLMVLTKSGGTKSGGSKIWFTRFKLNELKIVDDTIVVFFHDNGPNGWRWNGGMKGRKGSTDEGGVRSPLLVRWPRRILKGTQVRPIAAAIDLLPTLADCADIPVASKKKLDGRSLKPFLFGQKGRWKERIIFSHWKGRVSARTQKYRLDHTGKLFDMAADPGQRTDISKTKPDTAGFLHEQPSTVVRQLTFLRCHGVDHLEITCHHGVKVPGLLGHLLAHVFLFAHVRPCGLPPSVPHERPRRNCDPARV